MRRTTLMIAAVLVLAGSAGCGGGGKDGENGTPPPGAGAAPPPPVAQPMRVEKWQIIRVIIRDTGYEPDRFALTAGVPAMVIFVQESDSPCAAQVRIPDLGVETTDLPSGKETIVEFTPARPGTYTFTCGMDMMRGTILVTS